MSGELSSRARDRERKRSRYHADPSYREVVKARARARYVPVESPRATRRGPNRARYMPIGGAPVECVSLGALAAICGVSKQAIRRYEARGVIPVNYVVDQRGRRWYPKSFAEWLAPHVAEQARSRTPILRLTTRVEQAWEEVLLAGHMPVVEAQGAEEDGRQDWGCWDDGCGDDCDRVALDQSGF